MISGPYSPLKIIHHPERIDALRRGKQPAPAQVELVLSDTCNHDCSFCAFRMGGYTSNQLFGQAKPDGSVDRNPKRMIPYEKAIEILDDCQALGVKAVQLTGGGEPTVHPQCGKVMKAVLERGMELALVTNGARMSLEVQDALMHARWMRISLDAGTPETYGRIRGISPQTFTRVVHRLGVLAYKRDQAGSHLRIGTSFVVTHENYSEIAQAAEIVKRNGADSIRIGAMFQNDGDGYYDGLLDAIDAQRAAAREFADERFTVYDNFPSRLADLAAGRPEYRACGHQHFNTYIAADLNVYRCCTLAYNERGLLGSISNQRFAELWESDAKRSNMASFDARGCERCPFNTQNRAIAYAIDAEPDDVNFV